MAVLTNQTRSSRRITVAVTGMNAGDSPAPGVPVIRCLREHPHWRGRIIGLCHDALESGVLDPQIVDSAYLIPYPSSGSQLLLERLIEIHSRERLDAIIPNLDSELMNFITISDELKALGIGLFLPTMAQLRQREKSHLQDFCLNTGLNTPKTETLTEANFETLEKRRYPLLVKGAFYEAYIAYTREQATQLVNRLASSWGFPILLQEYIAGDEYNLVAVGDGQGGIISSAAMKKLVFTDKRKGWACVTIDNPLLSNFAAKVISALKWRGPLEIECIQADRDKTFQLIEVNPRFPAWTYLAKAAGANLPFLALELALGKEPDPPVRARPGVVFTNYTTNLVADLSSLSTLFTSGELHYAQDS